jgi:hypothetical protein
MAEEAMAAGAPAAGAETAVAVATESAVGSVMPLPEAEAAGMAGLPGAKKAAATAAATV